MKLLKKVKGPKLLGVLFFLLGVLFFLDHYKERTAINHIPILSIFIVHYQLTEVSNSPDHGVVDMYEEANQFGPLLSPFTPFSWTILLQIMSMTLLYFSYKLQVHCTPFSGSRDPSRILWSLTLEFIRAEIKSMSFLCV